MRVIALLALFAACSPRAALWTGAEGASLSVAELAVRATVALRDGGARWPQIPAGCGVLIGRREILTAGHAVKNGGGLQVELSDGSKRWARVVRSLSGPSAAQGPLEGAVSRDLALLRLDDGEGGSSHWLPIAADDPPPGTFVLAVGAPEAAVGAIVTGAVSRPRGVDGLVIGAHVEPGWSGGPVVSSRGELVGIVVRGRDSLTLAVPANAIRAGLPELRR
jgi:S1-C subfamily serine protease